MLTNVATYLICLMLALALVLAGAPPHPDVGTPSNSIRLRKVSGAGDRVAMTVPPVSIARGRRRKRGAIYARFSTKFQASIDDQIRACREWCEANDIDVDDAMIFIDRATSGKKSRRAGMDQLKAALNAKKIDVLVTFATNRLHRSGHKARQFMEEEVIENGVRGVCIRSGVDTADDKKWRLLHGVNAIV